MKSLYNQQFIETLGDRVLRSTRVIPTRASYLPPNPPGPRCGERIRLDVIATGPSRAGCPNSQDFLDKSAPMGEATGEFWDFKSETPLTGEPSQIELPSGQQFASKMEIFGCFEAS